MGSKPKVTKGNKDTIKIGNKRGGKQEHILIFGAEMFSRAHT